MSFESLGLTPELLRAVESEGYSEPTPVQAESIPHILAGRDILAGAQTGTGKTAAFVLPILQLLNATRPESIHMPGSAARRRGSGLPIRCLILTPTRELALQIEESVRVYGAQRPVRSVAIYGGVGFQPQVNGLKAGPEIVVATPGRLLDHIGQGTIDLGSVTFLVLDEADRMLDMGFIRDIRRVIALLPVARQNLLFSATFSDEIRDLAAGFLKDPAYVQVARRNAPIELVRQVVYPVDRERKRELLSHLVRSGRIDRALVFMRTKHGSNRLAEQLLHDGIAAAAIHGNRSQSQRVRALDDFKSGRVAILVATEVAARGLDIEALPHVVNFEMPTVPSDYVHRIGRTGRAGMEGDAISLVCVDEMDLLRDVEKMLRTPIAREVIPGFEVDRSIRPEPIRLRSNDRFVARPAMGRQASARPAPGRPAPSRQAPARPTGDRSNARPAPARPTNERPTPGWSNARPVSARPNPARPNPARPNSRPNMARPGASIGNWSPAPSYRDRPANPSGGYRGGNPGRPGQLTLPGERLSGQGNRSA